jgi:hypothetical protein
VREKLVKLPDFYDWLSVCSQKNLEVWLKFCTSNMIYSQILAKTS